MPGHLDIRGTALIRLLVLLLLAMNVGVAVWWSLRPAPTEPTPPLTDPGVPALQLLAEIDQRNVDPVAEVVGPPEPDVVDADRVCLELGPFLTQVDLRGAGTALTPSAHRIQLRETSTVIRRGFRVFIADPGTREAALATARALQARGIRDYYVVTAGAEQNTVSLGLYRDENNAHRRQREISALGFDVELEVRNEEIPQFWIDLELPAELDWRSALGGYSGVGSRKIPCR